jgi:hypothetical protein
MLLSNTIRLRCLNLGLVARKQSAISTTAISSSTTPTVTSAKAIPTLINNRNFSTKPQTQTKHKTLQSYNEHKKSQKKYRTKLYQSKINRKQNILPNRRNKKSDPKLKNQKKKEFHNWFDIKRNNERYYMREARRLGKGWKVKVGIMLERLPVVTDEREDWELEYMYMKANYDRERSIVYPKEIEGFGDPMDKEVLTLEELMEQLPEGYKPAPRITEDDKNNNIQSLNRKLAHRVYLTLRENDDSGWSLPIITMDQNENSAGNGDVNGESFVDSVKRYMKSNAMTKELTYRCLSNCPMGVDVIKYDNETGADTEYFGEKIFYMRVQYEDGEVVNKANSVDNWGWLERSEMVDRVKAEKGEDASLFYKYML